MPNKDNTYTAYSLEDLFKIPAGSGIVTYYISEGPVGNPETDEHGYIQYPAISYPAFSEDQINHLLKHPLSVVINPRVAESIYKYYELAVLFMDKKGIHLPLPYNLVSNRRKKLDRFKWSTKWYTASYEQFLDLGGYLTQKLKEKVKKIKKEPWETLEVFPIMEKINVPEKTEFEITRLFKVDASTKSKITKLVNSLLAEHNPVDINDKLLDATVERLSKLDGCSIEQAAVNSFADIVQFGIDHNPKPGISRKITIDCKEYIDFVKARNSMEFHWCIRIKNDGYKKSKKLFYPKWEFSITRPSRNRFEISGKVFDYEEGVKDISDVLNRKTLVRFLFLWLAGEYGVHVLLREKKRIILAEEEKKERTEKPCDALIREVLFYNQLISLEQRNQPNSDIDLDGNKICCLKYDKGKNLRHFPGKALMRTTGKRIDTFLEKNIIKPVLMVDQANIPLIPFKSLLDSTSEKYHFQKFCFLSTLIRLDISDKHFKKLFSPLNTSNTSIQKDSFPALRDALKKHLKLQSQYDTVLVSDIGCTKS